MAKSLPSSLWHHAHLFLGTISLLLILGLLFMYSASSVFALEVHGNHYYFVKRQLVGFALGFLGIIGIQFFSTAFIKKMSPYFFIGATLLTALTLIPTFTQRIHGSSRWLNISGFAFQPSELLKIALILYLAYAIEKYHIYRRSFWHGYIPLISILTLPSIILLKQPDFGLTVTLFVTTLLLLYIANFEIKHLVITLSSLIPVAILLVVMRPYRLQRVLTFLNPWHDPQGTGFQIIQSLIAIGSGGLSGTGIAQSKQKFFYLPMQHTDFIFSIIAEEIGFIGCTLLIILFMLFTYLGIRLAMQIQNQFASLTILGFILLLSLQTIINLTVATGLAPTKGIGLPFISYGNTALVSNLLMIGLIIRLVRDQFSA